jgi:hypothetical protein
VDWADAIPVTPNERAVIAARAIKPTFIYFFIYLTSFPFHSGYIGKLFAFIRSIAYRW